MIDLKTLYEQVTMYCNLIDTINGEIYKVEFFEQPDTPIVIRAYWYHNTLKHISFQIR